MLKMIIRAFNHTSYHDNYDVEIDVFYEPEIQQHPADYAFG